MSLSDDDLRTLDAYAREQRLPSRSAAVQHAIALLRAPALEQAYATAWHEWESSPDAAAWDATSRDGLRDDTAGDDAPGDICLVDLEPVCGSEANKTRPAVIVSNDHANTTADRLGRGVVTVVPVTSNVERVGPFQTLLPATECGLHRDAKAQAEQVRWVAVERIGPVIGRVPAQVMGGLDDALRVHLQL